jgi:hypothetical protein
VLTALSQIKTGKTVGPDGINTEAFKYGGYRLAAYLTFFFNLCQWRDYMPNDLMKSVFIPQVKNKTGDLTDVNNYHAIAISNSCSKVFELVMYSYLLSVLADDFVDDRKFGFKKSHSTALCTYVLKSIVSYYVERDSHVFCCYVDFSKAFDYVDCRLLIRKLYDS